jgi:hypothetical protein
MWFDSIVFTPQALAHLIHEVGSSRIVMGTDYPFPWMKTRGGSHPRHARPERRRARRGARRYGGSLLGIRS